MKDIACLCHMIQRLCEKIREMSPNVNYLISIFKKLLIKNNTNKQLLEYETKLTVPSFPIITQWGTWVKFGCFIYDNYNCLNVFVTKLVENCTEFSEFEKS